MHRTITSFLLFASALVAQKPFQNGQAARAVIGQVTFTKGDETPTQQVLGGAGGVAWAGNNLYVADSNRIAASPQDHRVLVFDTSRIPDPYRDLTTDPDVATLASCYVCGSAAFLTLGQDGFNAPTYIPSGTATSVVAFYSGLNGTQDPSGSSPAEHAWFYNATAVATDGTRLVVADTDNNRILIWTTIPNTNNQNPNLVLGQPDFATLQQQQLGVVSATAMRGPQGVWIKNNKLFVADTQNYRVLIWNTFPTTNNQPPDVVLGQPDFTHANGPAPSAIAPNAAANQLLNPVSVTADDSHIFVSDLGFNRVLIWNTLSPTTYQNADVVVGQVDFVQSASNNTTVCTNYSTGSTGQCAASLNFPRFALSDGRRLFIADGGNDRVLIYNSIPTANGAAANNVLGQTSFTADIVSSQAISIVSTLIDNTGAVDTTPTPTSLAWDGTNLYVADPYNRRILIFTPGDSLLPSPTDPAATVVPVVNWAAEIVRQEGTVALSVTAGGAITAGDTVTVTIQSVAYTYTEKSTDTIDGIVKELVRLINASDTNATAIFAGTGTGTLYLSSISSNLAFDSITLAATASNTANITATASGGYLTAGNAATASPYALIEINAPLGVSFTDSTSTLISDPTKPVPNTLGGVQVYLDGFASPLFKVSQTQIVAQVPYFYSDRNSTSVYVRTTHNDGSVTVTNATPVYIAPANPGIFNAQNFAHQQRPWPISMAYHQLNNPTVVVSVDGSVTAGDTLTITIGSTGYTYTVVSTDTLQTVVQGLVNLIAADPNVTPSVGGAFTRVVLTSKLNGLSGGNGIAVTTSTSATASITLTAYTSATCCAVQNGSLIYPGNPAVPGELISISAAGLGNVVDTSGNIISTVTGQPYSGNTQNNVLDANFLAATMGGSTAQVIYSGLPPGSNGIYRVDLIVPTGLAANDLTPLYIAQNAFISNTVAVPVGNAVSTPPPPPGSIASNPIMMTVDIPIDGATVNGALLISGWALDTGAKIQSVSILVDGIQAGIATYGFGRPDVCTAYPTGLNCPNPGFQYWLDTTLYANGAHNIQIAAADAAGYHYTASIAVTVSNDVSSLPTKASIDIPSPQGTQAYHGVVTFSGWALNTASPIASLRTFIDSIPGDAGTISYGTPRPDVCADYPSANCPNVGWTYVADLTRIANGPHTFTITAIAQNGQQYSVQNSFIVSNFASSNPVSSASGFIDLPSATAGTLSGTITVAGWALDPVSPLTNVAMAVDGVSYGNVTYGSSRTDVCAAFTTSPNCPNVGWTGSIDSTFLADGTHSLQITAYPAAGQPFTVTQTMTIGNMGSSANPVRAYIDNLGASSAPLSGTASVFGWALGQSSAMQTVTISVDGQLKGNAIYGSSRTDVCTAFPGSPNCPNVGWTYPLDTTHLVNGPHTMEVTGITAAGQRASAGTTFSVSNLGGPAQTYISAPTAANHAYSGLAQFNGWAINANAAVISVQITIDGFPHGTAIYGSARPDVCAVYPGRAGCPNVGWSYPLDTSTLADGYHIFGVIATAADGSVGTATSAFTVANWTAVVPMSIMIDNPALGVKVPISGSIVAYGWLYDSASPVQSVSVAVDGIPFGNAAYHLYRPDVCTSTAISVDCPNVGWSFPLDTTFLGNAIHTLSVTATTTAGQSYTQSQQFTSTN